MRLPAVLTAALGVTLAAAAWAADPAGLFDKPLREEHVPIANPQAQSEVTCATYPGFMVKQVDMGEVGAEQLSILPLAKGAKPACKRENAKGELVVPPDAWGGYFKGAKGQFVFFDADDGWNGGMGFAVFNAADGAKLYESAAQRFVSIDQPQGSEQIRLRFDRLYQAPCSLRADETGCWQIIRQATGLAAAPPPDCRASYEAEEKRLPDRLKEVDADPSVVEYRIEVMLAPGQPPKETPLSPAKRCFAAD